jgi:hypothetical protein
MNPPILVRPSETDAIRGDLRPSEHSPRPIPWPEKRPATRIGGPR